MIQSKLIYEIFKLMDRVSKREIVGDTKVLVILLNFEPKANQENKDLTNYSSNHWADGLKNLMRFPDFLY